MTTSPAPRSRRAAFIVSVALLFGSAGALGAAMSFFKFYYKKFPIEVDLKCSSLPPQGPHWVRSGKDEEMKEELVEALGTHNYLQRTYVEANPADPKNPRVVQLHLAYYTGMVDTVPHVPDRCFVAGGATMQGGPWDVHVPLNDAGWVRDDAATADTRQATGDKDAIIYSVPLGPDSKAPGNRVRLPRGIEKLEMRAFAFNQPGGELPMYSGYFFIANGGWTQMAQRVRLLAFDLRSDYAFYLKVQFTSTRIKGPEELANIAGSLLDDVLPDIMLCVPDWTEVIRGEYPADNPRRLKKLAEHPAP